MTIRWRLLIVVLSQAKILWLSLGLIFLTPCLFALTSATNEKVILYSGVILELAGIIVVAGGLCKLRVQFGKPPLKSEIARWFGRIADTFKPPRVVTSAATMAGESTLSAEGRIINNPGLDASPEERLAALERNIRALRDEMDRKIPELQRQIAVNSERIQSESRERQHDHQEIARRLEDFAVGDLHLELVGLLWVVLGLIETNIPAEIAGWFCHLL